MKFSDIWFEGFINQFFKSVNLSTWAGVAITLASIVVCCIIIPYLLGSINLSIMISSRFYNDDIRNHGSGNAGMTNVMRTYGKKMAVYTFTGDFFKAVIASLVGRMAFGVLGAYIAGLFCFLGHIFPVYYKFKGGKGVVTACAMILMANLPSVKVFFGLLAMFIVIVWISKFISLGSVVCMLVHPILLDRAGVKGWPVLIAFAMGLLCAYAHRENIKRIMRHEENRFSFKVKHKKTVAEQALDAEGSEEAAE